MDDAHPLPCVDVPHRACSCVRLASSTAPTAHTRGQAQPTMIARKRHLSSLARADPRGRVTWTWTYPEGSKRNIEREEWVAYLDAARALMRTRWPRGELKA